jgi:plasmid stabilization system protein ParE
MSAAFQFTPKATEDLDAIWWFIAEENRDAADRVELEIVATCGRLAKHPRIGTKRQDITALPVRFWTVTKFPNYVIVYRPDTAPLQVVAVLHGKRDLKEVPERRDG